MNGWNSQICFFVAMPLPRLLSGKVNLLKYMFLCITGGLIFLAGVRPGWQRMQSDFPNYWLGSRLLVEQRACDSLYHNDWFQESLRKHGFTEQGKFSPFPPPTTYLFLPLTPLPPLVAKRVWMVISLLLVAWIIWLFGRISGMNGRDATAWVLATGLALINNLYLGQVYLLMVAFMLYGWIQFRKGKTIVPGICFGIVAAIKYFPLVMLPEWLLKRRWKLILTFALTITVLGLLSLYSPGVPACRDFLNRVVFAHLDGRLEGQSPFATAFQSWNALSHRLFLFDAAENPHPWFHAPLLLQLVRHGIPALLLFFGIVHARRLILRNAIGAGVAILCLSMLVASPASASYHLLLLLFPMALLLEDETGRSRMSPASTRLSFLLLMGIGWAPLFIGKFLAPATWPIPFQFYRLWLMLVIWLVAMRLTSHRFQVNPDRFIL